METLATIIILVPVLLPMILQLGIDPIHFGIVLVVTNNAAMLDAAVSGAQPRGVMDSGILKSPSRSSPT